MRKLISAKDIEIAVEKGKRIIYIDSNTIVTSLAKDMAEINEIEICNKPINKIQNSSKEDIDMDMIFGVIKKLMDKGLLSEVMDLIGSKPYEYEEDLSGLKLIKGNTIRFKKIEGEDSNKVFYRELIDIKESSVKHGILNIEESDYINHTCREEVYYIVEGEIKISINDNKYIGSPGDVLYIPKDSKIKMSSSDKAKLFYTTYLEQ